MLASCTFASTGDLGNSTGSFSEESFSINAADSNSKQISFVFTPSADLKPGQYTMMIGAENDMLVHV
jgi:virginiamycin B lyase